MFDINDKSKDYKGIKSSSALSHSKPVVQKSSPIKIEQNNFKMSYRNQGGKFLSVEDNPVSFLQGSKSKPVLGGTTLNFNVFLQDRDRNRDF